MNKIFIKLILFVLTCLTQGVFAQGYDLISTSLNYPIKYKTENPDRELGVNINYMHGFKLNKNLFFETGLAVNTWGKINKQLEVYYYENKALTTNNIDQTYFRLEVELPCLLNYRIKKWGIKNGINMYRRFLLQDLNDNKQLDPELNPNHPYPKVYKQEFELYGIDYELKISYSITKKLAPFIDYRTSILYFAEDKSYGVVNLGIIYKISNR